MTLAEHPMPWIESSFLPYRAEPACPPGRVLVLAPHPDDETFGCGGAIMRHADAGDPVRVVVATDSSYGRFDEGEEGVGVRRRESMAAARVLGYADPVFWGLPDRGLVYDERLVQRVLDAVTDHRATLVYAPSWWEIHPDHQVLALAAAEALRRCPRPVVLSMYEVGVPLHPNRLLDITDLLARKQAAMACFDSQLRLQRYDRHVAALNRYRTYTLPDQVEAAEAYRLLRPEELRQDPLRAIRPGLYYGQGAATVEPMPQLVSILVLCRDRKALADALDSAMLQTYPHIEIVTLAEWNGVRPDLSPWREGRFPLRSIEPGAACLNGAGAANLTMEHARGDYLVFVADGECLDPPHVSALAQALHRPGSARCVCAGVRRVPASGGEVEETDHCSSGKGPADLLDYRRLTPNAVLFERSLFTDGCRFDEQLGWEVAVWDFWIQLSCRTPFLPVDQVSATHQVSADADPGDVAPIDADAANAADVIEKGRVATSKGALLKELARHALAREAQERALRDAASRYRNAEARARQSDARRLELQQRVDALESSTSWRVTGPLRALTSMLRRCARKAAQ